MSADFPYCLDGDVSEVSIEADMPCEVRIISGRELQALFDSDPKMMLHRSALPLATNGTRERADTDEPVQDGLCPRPRSLPLHRPQPLPPSTRTLPKDFLNY